MVHVPHVPDKLGTATTMQTLLTSSAGTGGDGCLRRESVRLGALRPDRQPSRNDGKHR